ncbi:hypothetical protein EX30DRAFT_394423 [Ascodesmis nigricans]|uniref:Uncharacterized protein n=1 Tax=Ascodesmis nigricans TaxID=341454 RepID=A0A4V3SJ99_9PEZI|nr:hypothetical protein EX30DRAFT_394423 [Ascodesmis nigricans]
MLDWLTRMSSHIPPHLRNRPPPEPARELSESDLRALEAKKDELQREIEESYKSTKENEERMLVEHDTTRRQIADLILKREKLEEGMEKQRDQAKKDRETLHRRIVQIDTDIGSSQANSKSLDTSQETSTTKATTQPSNTSPLAHSAGSHQTSIFSSSSSSKTVTVPNPGNPSADTTPQTPSVNSASVSPSTAVLETTANRGPNLSVSYIPTATAIPRATAQEIATRNPSFPNHDCPRFKTVSCNCEPESTCRTSCPCARTSEPCGKECHPPDFESRSWSHACIRRKTNGIGFKKWMQGERYMIGR